MKKPTTISKESVSEYREFVQLRLRKRVLEAIEVVLEEEVNQALGCGSYERAEDRRGYRNGAETRRVTTSVGTRELRVPRARVRDEETGETTEFSTALGPGANTDTTLLIHGLFQKGRVLAQDGMAEMDKPESQATVGE